MLEHGKADHSGPSRQEWGRLQWALQSGSTANTAWASGNGKPRSRAGVGGGKSLRVDVRGEGAEGRPEWSDTSWAMVEDGGVRSDIKGDQVPGAGSFSINRLSRVILERTGFDKDVRDGPKRRFRSLTKVWGSKEPWSGGRAVVGVSQTGNRMKKVQELCIGSGN